MRRAVVISSVVCCCLAGPARAGGGAATDAYDDITGSSVVDVHGLLDAYAIHNFNDPVSGANQLREFDFRDRASLDYARLTLAGRPRPVGFRLDVGAGNTADVFEQQDPARAQHPTYARATSFVGQAFVTAVVPFARPVELDAGKFSTPIGMEDNEAIGNWNYSRSLLFSWAEPTLHTGLRATTRLSDTLAVSLFWVNGWNAGLVDGSGMRTVAGAATWRPIDGIEVAVADLAGLEHPPTDLTAPLSFRNLFDAYVILSPDSLASFAFTADVGNDRAEGGVHWWGAAWYARLQGARGFAATLRGEYLSDPEGFVTGTRQALAGLTTTAEAGQRVRRVRLVERLEYRHDQSTADAFDAATPASRTHQDTITLAFMSAF
ncbi:MAG TPA: outer membrane beta-barrel protein [Polyangia bacterium]|nr:outer membrane beta-barrel protein [Polyangia bacterium]